MSRSALIALLVTSAICPPTAECALPSHRSARTAAPSIELFFSLNGIGACHRVVATLDLQTADAVLARAESGGLQCKLSETLDDDGCDIHFYESLDKGELKVLVDGCTIPAATMLFNCYFTQVDVIDIRAATSALCACSAPGCDEFPPVCIGPQVDDTCTYTPACGNGFLDQSEEECDDGGTVDEDGCSAECENQRRCGDATGDDKLFASDALRTLQRAVGLDVDCPDWICDVNSDDKVAAGDALALLKVSVGLSVPLICGDPTALVLRLVTPTVLGSLQLDVDYDGVDGNLPGAGADVACSGLIHGALFAFNDKPTRVLSMSTLLVAGFSGPRSIARCEFPMNRNVEIGDFVVTIVEATSPGGQAVPGVMVEALPY